ncbi:MAG: hypothetical protein UZ21_OP11001000191 [Microgenomates bacterium OLB22]|nr:MAG: hypothetical protein UZ21_OP11001000191 [Microgenomates bacterium OLB22]
MNIALVHDQLFEFGGAERVFFALKRLYPHADVYTAFYDSKKLEKHAPEYRDWNIHVSWAARIPFIKNSTHLYAFWPHSSGSHLTFRNTMW